MASSRSRTLLGYVHSAHMHSAHCENDRLANLIGAFALAITDRARDAVRSAADAGDSVAAALVHLSHAPPGGIDTLRRALGLSHSATVRLVDD